MADIFDQITIDQTQEPQDIFTNISVGKKPVPLPARIAAKAGAEIFGGAMGGIQELLHTASELKPVVEQAEEFARPGFLGSAGLEPAPEKGLMNLMALLGQTEFVKKYRPQFFREKFKETTGGRLEPQTAVERIIAKAAGAAGEGLPIGLPFGIGGAGGLAEGIAKELGATEEQQALAGVGGMGAKGLLKFRPKLVKVPKVKPSGMPVRKFEKLKKPTRVFRSTAEKAIRETEGDFRKLTSDLQNKTNRSYRAMTEDPTFKAQVSDIFEQVEKGAAKLKDPVSTQNLANQLHGEMRKTRQRGISQSDTEITKQSQLTKFFIDTKGRKFTATQLLDQFRKNNEQLSKLYPYGEKALENIGKREALEAYNRAIANTIQEQFPKTEFADLFKFTNNRWSEIKKIETVDKYIDAVFKGDKINFRLAEKVLTDPKQAGRLKNAIGKQSFAEFKQIHKDLLSREQALKMLNAKGFSVDDIPKKALYFLIKPKTTAVFIGKDLVERVWRTALTNPQQMRKWRMGASLFKRGHVKEALKILPK